MTNDILFWTQIGTLVAYIGSVFYLYQLLVKQKDATIDSKNSTIELLREKTNSLKEQLEQAKQSSPDILAERLSKRVEILRDELKTLSQDHDAKQEEILAKEQEIKKAEKKILKLNKQIDEAQELLKDYVCPHCKSPMTIHDYFPASDEINGREIDYDVEVTEYECGLKMVDGKETTKCGHMAEVLSYWKEQIKKGSS